jgi:dolichol-phosphate mannosyltransferase
LPSAGPLTSNRRGLRLPRLLRKLDLRRVGRVISWTAVGLSGLVVNSLAMWGLAAGLSVNYLFAAVAATQISSTWNFTWVDNWVFRGAKRSTLPRRWFAFLSMSNMALVLRIPMLALFVSVLGMHYLVANTLTLLLTFFTRFAAQERLSAPEVVS